MGDQGCSMSMWWPFQGACDKEAIHPGNQRSEISRETGFLKCLGYLSMLSLQGS